MVQFSIAATYLSYAGADLQDRLFITAVLVIAFVYAHHLIAAPLHTRR